MNRMSVVSLREFFRKLGNNSLIPAHSINHQPDKYCIYLMLTAGAMGSKSRAIITCSFSVCAD